MFLPHRKANVIVSWSGGIDSTALIAQMLAAGFNVTGVCLVMYGGSFNNREHAARVELSKEFNRRWPGQFNYYEEKADWIWAFSPDGVEIPRRNRHIIDRLLTYYAYRPVRKFTHIGLGEYIGCDSWVVSDHIGGEDADARALTAYVYREYGLTYRLWTLADFGESRYKHHRLQHGFEAPVNMHFTTNCLADYEKHCGTCYKCLERHAAFQTLGVLDVTNYITPPTAHKHYVAYLAQMQGEAVSLPFKDFVPSTSLPKPITQYSN